MKNRRKPYDIEEVKRFIMDSKSKKEVLDFLHAHKSKHQILMDLIKEGDIELLRKLPSSRFGGRECDLIATVFGDEGLDYIPAKQAWRKDEYRGKKVEILKDGIGYDQYHEKYYISYSVYVDGVSDHRFGMDYYPNLKELSKANDGSLSGLDLSRISITDKEKESLDFSGVYVMRSNADDCANSIPVDYKIISKLYHEEEIYDGRIIKPYFSVEYGYIADNGKLLSYGETKEFRSFNSFVRYLKKDLSDADIRGFNTAGVDLSKLNLEGALYDEPRVFTSRCLVDDLSERSHQLALLNNSLPTLQHEDGFSRYYAFYISDMHLDHKIIKECRSDFEIKKYLKRIAAELENSQPNEKEARFSFFSPLIILGDISCSFEINKYFLQELSEHFNNIILVLGNHELWGTEYQKQIEKYQAFCNENGVALLNNSLLVVKDGEYIAQHKEYYTEDQLNKMSDQNLTDICSNSRCVFFGGIGYSGLNTEFNANNGIYRGSLSRDEEIEESGKIEKLHRRLCDTLGEQQVIFATHMPKQDWTSDPYNPNWIYLHGHTHRNSFKNDETEHVFADNQIGYEGNRFTLNHFNFDGRYDLFDSYADGIFDITAQSYKAFCFGKNIVMQYTTKQPVIMLKKNGYYVFMRKTANGFAVLNGGRPIKCEHAPEYYYENIEKEVDTIMKPLEKYTHVQEEVARFVKSFGGSGDIHGAIVDIDFYNHLFVYPNGVVVPYYATDIINKTVYEDLELMLQERTPKLYAKYQKNSAVMPRVINNIAARKSVYLDTDIYKASNTIRSMQYLKDVKVIRKWYPILEDQDEQVLTDAKLFLEEH